jgi:proteasome lid subunit RPN8/RPN11
VAKDTGTTAAAGMIGMSRHFEQGMGINCGEKIATYPTGASPHSTEAWFRAQQTNAPIMAWGNDAPQGKLILQIASPPHIKVECWFSGADVQGQGKLPLSQWIHVVHTYQNGDSRIYVNGALDGTSTSTASPLAIKSPARMYIGGWYDNYKFVGEIDEARLSKVTRSADWVKLQYENQKPLQSVVGPLVRPGTDFALSAKTISLPEGKSVTVTAKEVWVQRAPDKDEKPVDNQFYARDDNNEGMLYYNGTLTDSADSVFLRLYADDKLVETESQKPKADKSYAFAIKLKAALVIYKVEFGTKSGTAEKIQQTVSNLVCGDAYI